MDRLTRILIRSSFNIECLQFLDWTNLVDYSWRQTQSGLSSKNCWQSQFHAPLYVSVFPIGLTTLLFLCLPYASRATRLKSITSSLSISSKAISAL